MKTLQLTPRAVRWLHSLIHMPGMGVKVDDLEAAGEAVREIDARMQELEALTSGAGANGADNPYSRGLSGAK